MDGYRPAGWFNQGLQGDEMDGCRVVKSRVTGWSVGQLQGGQINGNRVTRWIVTGWLNQG